MWCLFFQADHLSDFGACVSEVKLSNLFVRMQILSHCRNTHTVYNTYCVHIIHIPVPYNLNTCLLQTTKVAPADQAYIKLRKLASDAYVVSRKLGRRTPPEA